MTLLSDLSDSQLQVLRLFLGGQALTKPEIAARTSLSNPAAAAHVEALVERGLINGNGPQGSRGRSGRPAVEYTIVDDAACGVGVEVGSTHIRTLIRTLGGTHLYEHARALGTQEHNTLETVVRQEIVRATESMNSNTPVVGVGLALPGAVDCNRRLLLYAPNMFTRNVSFDSLEHDLGLPVHVDNGANAAAIAEYHFLPEPRISSMVLVMIREGVGGAAVLNGRLIHGDRWRAGEFGHMRIGQGDRPCNCGRKGCWEQYVSEQALLKAISHVNENVQTIDEILSALASGNTGIRNTWRDYVQHLAMGIENISACVDPELIIIGGPIAHAGTKLTDPLRSELQKEEFFTQTKIVVSTLAENGWVIGACLLSFGEVYYRTTNERIMS